MGLAILSGIGRYLPKQCVPQHAGMVDLRIARTTSDRSVDHRI
jgi:hypothetical protein